MRILRVLSIVTTFLAVPFAWRVAGVHADEREIFGLSVHLQVDRAIAARVILDDVKDEAQTLWRPYGVELNWIDGPDPEAAAGGLFVEATVERRIDGPEEPDWRAVLGYAAMQPDASGRRPVRVSFDATQKVLGLRHDSKPIVRDREMARALGRVLAHEIGHVLLGPPYHDRTGLMRPGFDPKQLATWDRRAFRLTCASADGLRRRLRALTEDTRFAAAGPGNVDVSHDVEPEGPDRAPCIPGPAAR